MIVYIKNPAIAAKISGTSTCGEYTHFVCQNLFFVLQEVRLVEQILRAAVWVKSFTFT